MSSNITVDFNANIARFSSSLDKATNDLNKFQTNASRMSGALSKSFASLGVALGGALSVTAFAGWIKGSIDAADELSKLSQKTGTAVEELAGLKFAADQNGTSLEAVANAAKRLSASIIDKPELFKKIGITAKDSTGSLVQLADIFKNMPDGVEKTALAVKLMGKSGEEMIPFLNQGSEALAELTAQGKLYNPVTAESAKQAELFNDQIDALKAQANGLSVTIANDMLPAMTEITTAMSLAAKEGGLLKAAWVGLGGLGAALFTGEFDDAAQQIVKLRGELGSLERHREQTLPGRGGILQKWLYGTTAEIDIKIAATKKQIADLQAQIDKPSKPKAEKKTDGKGSALLEALGGKDGKSGKSKKPKELEDFDQHIKDFQKMQDEARREITQSALEAQRIIADIDPIYKATLAWNDLTDLIEGGFITAEQAAQYYEKTFNDVVKKTDEATNQMTEFARRAGENIQDAFAEFLFDPFKGGLDGMLNNFTTMLRRMAAEALASQILSSVGAWGKTGGGAGSFVGGLAAAMFGKSGGSAASGAGTSIGSDDGLAGIAAAFSSYAGGGFTGTGSRSGGVDGKGGFPAILHPNETVIDHSRGQQSKSISVINNFILSNPTDRRTQEQVAAMAGASIQNAMLRGA